MTCNTGGHLYASHLERGEGSASVRRQLARQTVSVRAALLTTSRQHSRLVESIMAMCEHLGAVGTHMCACLLEQHRRAAAGDCTSQ